MPQTAIHVSEIIEMAWDDQVSFDSIRIVTGLTEKEVIVIMRKNMKRSSFKMWRKRVSGRRRKHEMKMHSASVDHNSITLSGDC